MHNNKFPGGRIAEFTKSIVYIIIADKIYIIYHMNR